LLGKLDGVLQVVASPSSPALLPEAGRRGQVGEDLVFGLEVAHLAGQLLASRAGDDEHE